MRDIEDHILPYCATAQVRRDCLLDFTIWPTDGKHDPRADCTAARRRLAKIAQRRFPGTSPQQESRFGRSDGKHWCQAWGSVRAAIAIAWVLRDSAVSGAIVGARRPEQVNGLIDAISVRLGQAEIEEISHYLPEGMGTNVPSSVA